MFDLYFMNVKKQAKNHGVPEPSLPRHRNVSKRFEVGSGQSHQPSSADEYFRRVYHCAKNVVYDSVYFCVYFAYTINIPRVVYITNIHLVYFKNPQVTIIHCAYSRSIKNTQTTMNLQIR